MDFLTVGIAMLAISLIVMASFDSMGLMVKKLEISQIARKYILVMETKGCLKQEDKLLLVAELEKLGLQEIDLTGTTLQPVNYGDTIQLKIQARVRGGYLADRQDVWSEGFGARDYYVEETRMSTAKN